MWNSCINKLIDQPSLSIPNFDHGLALIIPGNVKNSDLTMPKSTFKSSQTRFKSNKILLFLAQSIHNI